MLTVRCLRGRGGRGRRLAALEFCRKGQAGDAEVAVPSHTDVTGAQGQVRSPREPVLEERGQALDWGPCGLQH